MMSEGLEVGLEARVVGIFPTDARNLPIANDLP
jgi:hypothetical protein